MTIADWTSRPDAFLDFDDRRILSGPGSSASATPTIPRWVNSRSSAPSNECYTSDFDRSARGLLRESRDGLTPWGGHPCSEDCRQDWRAVASRKRLIHRLLRPYGDWFVGFSDVR